MHAFSHLVARTRSQLIAWRTKGLNSIDSDLKCLEQEIQLAEINDVLSNSEDHSNIALTTLYNRYAALQRQNSIKWAQRPRMLWVHDGDLNTSFFYNSIHI